MFIFRPSEGFVSNLKADIVVGFLSIRKYCFIVIICIRIIWCSLKVSFVRTSINTCKYRLIDILDNDLGRLGLNKTNYDQRKVF